MKLLDRYIIRQFLTTALFSLGAVLLVFIIIDSMEKLDDFLDKQAGLSIILLYYVYFVPEIIKLITPVALLLGSLFVTARMSTQSELTAFRASGTSLYRLMLPYVLVSLVVSGVLVYFNGWVVPLANSRKFSIERTYLHKDVINASGANIYVQDSPTRILSIGFFDDSRNVASRVSIQEFDAADPTRMVERTDAASMAWDSSGHRWVLSNVTKRMFSGDKESLEQYSLLPAGPLHFSPDDLRKKQEKPDEMSYGALKEFIQNQRRAGQDVSQWMVDFYGKISYPFAAVIVVLFGVPFASVRRRGGTGVQLGISLLICFIYLIVMKVSQVFGYNGDVNPLLTAWAANLVFFAGAMVVILRVRK
ncbi:MAG TPA: LPS export ABC transporter permease LptG [Bacteroidota bacterium]|nr:LPS export ABC transporter permease LptG [Bacteroidota bacterium]